MFEKTRHCFAIQFIFGALLSIFLLLGNVNYGRASDLSPIPDTGQTKCYDEDGEEIDCPTAGQDYYGQDGNYLINPPAYTKLDANGNDLPDSAISWFMVRDNVTGLVWEKKSDDGSLHDKDNTYSWADARDTFIAQMNANCYGGYSDWRLPAIEELTSIIDFSVHHPASCVQYFPNTVSSNYYSCTTMAEMTSYARVVNFDRGWDGKLAKTEYTYVRAVRGEVPTVVDRFLINGDGTVTDSLTGLMWQQETPESRNWKAAFTYCSNLTLAGYDDWRLPNQTELRTIVDYSRSPAIDTNYFPMTYFSHYWSSTTYVSHPDAAYYISSYDGEGFADDKTMYSDRVRAVRGGQPQITGHLIILQPKQGSFWSIGEILRIQWETQNIAGNVAISISREGGKSGTFQSISTGTANDGSFDWTVSETASVNCVLKIEPVSEPGKGTSQGLFSIQANYPNVTTGTVSQITADTALASGNVISDCGSPVSARGVCWSTTENPTTTDNKTIEGTGIGTFTSSITGFESNTSYHVRAYATNGIGTSYGSDVTFRTYSSVLYVSTDNECGGKEPCYNTIQKALAAAQTGALVLIAEGQYKESISVSGAKSLAFEGGWNKTFTTQTANKTFINAPTVPDGSLTMRMLSVTPN